MSRLPTLPPPIDYPESDGQPMADNTRQLEWIFIFVGNLRALYRDDPNVFVGGNQNWYPVEGHPEIVNAPDVYVAFGRPKGHRSSWKQWLENDTPLTVVFEVRSPSDSDQKMRDKFFFYEEHGAEEYYMYDPETNTLEVYVRGQATLAQKHPAHGFVSPRLGIRFDLSGDEMAVYYPDGRRFLAFEELAAAHDSQSERADTAEQRADTAEQRADAAVLRARRLAELSRKARLGQASAQEIAELERLEAEASAP
jgi:Uma2 family endonuclease